MTALSRLFSIVLLLTALGGCALNLGGPRLVDGLSIGSDAGCGACDQRDTSDGCGACESIRTIAIRRLDESWPGHPEVRQLGFFHEGPYPGSNGELILNTRSGTLVVVVATFADGTLHATSVYCGVGGCR